MAQLRQQSEKFDELALLNKELSTLNSKFETLNREKSEAKLQAQHKLVADLEVELVEARKQFQANSKDLEGIPRIQEQLSQLQRYSELLEQKQKIQNVMNFINITQMKYGECPMDMNYVWTKESLESMDV